ncbi:hypothetical protein [Fodinibius sp. AD559]|uniref:hypothetical protein n=1 Tax=Fodinibius sp. AD559 TaxID=3424179 RepID=UPI004046F5DA
MRYLNNNIVVIAAIMLSVLFPKTLLSQDAKASEILETLQENYEESIEGINDYVMVTNKQTIYYKKAYDNGRPYFKTRTENPEGVESTSAANVDFYSQLFDQVKEKATYEKPGEVENQRVHILYVYELEVESLNNDPDIDNTIENLYLYIDPDKWVIRKLECTMDMIYKNEPHEVNAKMVKSDFRSVEGMLIPYEMTTVISGLALSEEEYQEAKKAIEKFEEMPESQRRMAEQMMGEKIAKYRKMLEESRYEVVRQVKEVEVNTGMENF